MVKKVLLDSDFIIALLKHEDSNHLRAKAKHELLKEAKLYISHYVPFEVATVLSNRASQNAAREFIESYSQIFLMLDSAQSEYINLTNKLFINQTKKGTSWIDCHNVVCMEAFNMNAIVSFDSFYKKCGVKVL